MQGHRDRRQTWLHVVAAVLLLCFLVLTCCLPTPPPDPAAGTLTAQAIPESALRTDVAQIKTLNARRGMADAELATEVASQGTVIAYLATRVGTLATPPSDLTTSVAQNGTVVAYLATRVGAIDSVLDVTPTRFPPTPTPYTNTPTPVVVPSAPVTGSVEIEGGRCCAGGIAGETIPMEVSFSASSAVAEVTEMRVRAGGIAFDEVAMALAEWEPYVETKTYSVTVALNWVGWHVSAQYRDAAGNVSPVVHDDISIEGAPKPPTPTPTP